jgi:hypothetical protein
MTAEAAGVASPRLVHIASDFITACYPDTTGTLLGDSSTLIPVGRPSTLRLMQDGNA